MQLILVIHIIMTNLGLQIYISSGSVEIFCTTPNLSSAIYSEITPVFHRCNRFN